MARGEGEAGLRSHFVERVVRLPMVHVAWDIASNTYTHIKESNKLVNFTLTNAEKSVTFVAGQAKPVVLKFERQIQAVDDLACKGLGTLEEKVPFITKPADEIIGDTRKLYARTVNSRLESIKRYGNDKVKSVTDYGLGKANYILSSRLVQSVLTSVDGALVVTENYIDHVLPPVNEDPKKDLRKEKRDKRKGLARLTRLSNKIRHRAYRNVMLRVELVQERSIELFLIYPVQMVEFAKGHADAIVDYANKLWVSIRQEESDSSSEAQAKSRVEQQLLLLARLVARQLASAYSTVSNSLPGGKPKPSSEVTESTQEPSQAPAAFTAVKDRALWMYGVLRVVPALLPMYIYIFLTWLNQKRNGEPEKEDYTAVNGVANKDQSNNHNNTNNVHVDREHNYCTSIEEEHPESCD